MSQTRRLCGARGSAKGAGVPSMPHPQPRQKEAPSQLGCSPISLSTAAGSKNKINTLSAKKKKKGGGEKNNSRKLNIPEMEIFSNKRQLLEASLAEAGVGFFFS